MIFMKKLLLIIAILFTTQASFAVDVPYLASTITKSFEKDFSRASEVQWNYSESYAKASFVLDDQLLNAYYTHDGELIAVIRNILSAQLPLNLLLDLKKKYGSMWISELFEVVSGTEKIG